MKIIGLTGGIGSGKSTVSSYLAEKGYKIIDADKIAHDITSKGSPVLFELAEAFGKDILEPDGSLNRRKLAAAAFVDNDGRKILNGITHRVIFEEIDGRIREFRNSGQEKIIFLDAPLLFESGLDSRTEENWVVYADTKTRMERVKSRDGLSESEILDRINSQMDEKEKLERATYVLDNSGSREDLFVQIERLLEKGRKTDDYGAEKNAG